MTVPDHAPPLASKDSAAGARVLFVERRLPAYRVPFFDVARQALAARGIAFELAHGQADAEERSRDDAGRLDWALPAPNRYVGRLSWQPVATSGFDLVIASHENRLLYNLWLGRPGRPHRFAYFGHGANFAARQPDAWRERFKQATARRADWWFAYTELSAARLRQAGVAPGRITVVDNAIDTSTLAQQVAAFSPNQAAQRRAALGLHAGKTALFIGSLHAAKRLDLLFDTAQRCAQADPAFRLLVVGDGPDAARCRSLADQGAPWLHWLGAQHGPQRAEPLALADLLLMPAAVGLGILDGFAAGLPLLTTSLPGHGPEIAYLRPGGNGEITEPDAATLSQALQSLLNDPARLARLQAGAREAAARHTLAAMVERFAGGVQAALVADR